MKTKTICIYSRLTEYVSREFNKVIFLTTIISTYLIGLMAHGMAIFNKISYHDDFLRVSSAGLACGRWGGLVYDLVARLFFKDFLSTPVLFGLVALSFFSLSAYLICVLFEVKKIITAILVSGLLVAFPAVTSTFGYMIMIHTYSLSIFLTVFSAFVICKAADYRISIPMCFIMSFAIGIYQATIATAITVFLGYMILCAFKKEDYTYKSLIKDLIYYVINSGCFFVLYIVVLKILLYVFGEELSEYQGINSMAEGGIFVYFSRVMIAYKQFFIPERGNEADLYPFYIRYFYFICILLVLFSFFIIMRAKFSRIVERCIYCIILIAAIPIAIEFIYIMVDANITHVYSIMLYSHVFSFIICIILSEKVLTISRETISYMNRLLSLGCVIIVLVFYVRFANICYTKALVMQEEAKSYFTTLIGRIQSTEGYTMDLPVMYVNDGDKRVDDTDITNFELIVIPPYWDYSIVNTYSWREFMRIWCGYMPKEVEVKDIPEIDSMPRYPDEGSIRVIDGIIVVNF